MATNHVAIMRSSARMAQQQQQQQQQKDSELHQDGSSLVDRKAGSSSSSHHFHHNNRNNNSNLNDLSGQMSVISMSSSEEGEEMAHELSIRKVVNQKQAGMRTKSRTLQLRSMMASLGEITSISHIDNSVDQELHEAVVIDRLLNKWIDISSNLDTVMSHLNKCSEQVTSASICCLETLVDSVNVTCDKVDEHVKALHKLMAKCDELGTKISVAGSFCDEIKTLKKSVDTLENLYKTRPQKPIQPISSSSN